MKIWEFPAGKTLEFDDEIGQDLLSRYDFLEKVKASEDAQVLEVAEGFSCSRCEYTNKTKVAVFGHIRSHTEEKIEFEQAEPVGDAKPGKTLYEARAEVIRRNNPEESALNVEEQSAGLYGPGLVEER